MKKPPYRIRDGFKPITGLFAFWSYDLFPFVLGGPVMAMDSLGRVQVSTYGGGVFMPIKLVPLAVGIEKLKTLEVLRAGQRKAIETLNEAWFANVLQVIPEAKR